LLVCIITVVVSLSRNIMRNFFFIIKESSYFLDDNSRVPFYMYFVEDPYS